MIKSHRPSAFSRRPPSAEHIARSLRRKIIDEAFTPGQRLPTHVEIERKFRSTPPTVSKALEMLRRDGFIRSEQRSGIFVADRPPHRHHYALALPFRQDDELSQFYVALRNEAARFDADGRYFSTFYDINDHTDVEDFQRLLTHVRSRRLAGLIFAQPALDAAATMLIDEASDLPRVIMASSSPYKGIPAVSPGTPRTFIEKALDYLRARGRRRVAMLTSALDAPDSPRVHLFTRAARQRGMTCRPHLMQFVQYGKAARWARNQMQLLMRCRERPDALVILDDNVVEHATAGIAASGVRVPEDLDIVAHANFPWPTPSAVPVRRLGYDVRRMLALCVERLDALRRGERPPALTYLPALFEEEVREARPVLPVFVSQRSVERADPERVGVLAARSRSRDARG